MKIVALLSGGKDSCYNIVKCLAYGHEVVALAHLAPPKDAANEEINSFMYQTAGSSAMSALAECFELPLIVRHISGQAVQQGMSYASTDGDEVEDLYELLKSIKELYPDIQGVSCGAILSNYQRNRVENVSSRLGLTVIAFLWQRKQGELLNEMIDCGIDAVLVKVAGAGLDPYKHLNKTLSSMRQTFITLNAKFGLDLCGEGGEYETLVLNCPAFKSKMVTFTDTEIILDEEDASVGNLLIKSCEVVAKSSDNSHCDCPVEKVYQFGNLVNVDIDSLENELIPSFPSQFAAKTSEVNVLPYETDYIRMSLGLDGLFQTEAVIAENEPSVTSAVNRIFTQLQTQLRVLGSDLSDVALVHVYISDLTYFAEMNGEYNKWFGENPPSRSCVVMPLPDNVKVQIDVIGFIGSYNDMKSNRSSTRKVLHVKSLSEWAPLCIGPYAQSNQLQESVLFVAGQIPLNPATMDLAVFDATNTLSMVTQATLLSLRHVSRVLETMDSNLTRAMSCLIYVDRSVLSDAMKDCPKISSYLKAVVKQSIRSHLFVSDNSQVNNKGGMQAFSRNIFDVYQDEISDNESCESSDEKSGDDDDIPVIIIPVSALPRNAPVEVEMIAVANKLLPGTIVCDHRRINNTISEEVNDEAVQAVKHENSNCARKDVSSWPLWPGHEMREAYATLAHDKAITDTMVDLAISDCEVDGHVNIHMQRSKLGDVMTCVMAEVSWISPINNVEKLQSYVEDVFATMINQTTVGLSHFIGNVMEMTSIRVYCHRRVYQQAHRFIRRCIRQRIECHWGIQDCAVNLLPLEDISDIASDLPHMIWQITSMDTVQAKSELWIHGY